MYTEADYLMAKLRGEIVDREEIEYIEMRLIGDPYPTAIPAHITKIPAETCEQWLSRMNSIKMPRYSYK